MSTQATPPVDLTPRTGRSTSRSKWPALVVVGLIAATVVGLVWFLLTNSQSFLEADIAVAEREEQGDRRFQLLGSPIADWDDADLVQVGDDSYAPFTVAFDGVLVDVVSQGIPPDLFAQGVPVVLEGNWVQGESPIGEHTFVDGANDGWHFEADRLLVKHDNDYLEQDDGERIEDAEERGRVPEATGADAADDG